MAITSATRLVVFDCDGTIIDGQHAIRAAMSEAFEANGLGPPSESAVRRVVGLPLAGAVARLAPDVGEELVECLAAAYKESFQRLRQRPDHYEPLFPGALETLELLNESGFSLGIATGKSRKGLVAALERHGLSRHFTVLKTSDDGPGKPDPCMLVYAMSDAGAEPGSTVMVGDTVFDIEMARSARVLSIGVGWGYHEGAELKAAGAAAVVQKFDELPALIERFIGRT